MTQQQPDPRLPWPFPRRDPRPKLIEISISLGGDHAPE